ncbi:MAG: DNA-3-methyladenine glycosylase family protein, partial [Solirubrobacteraceae bacterium]
GADRVIGHLATAAPGRRVPGHPDGCELAVRAVLGQQVSVTAGTKLVAQLVSGLGTPLAEPVGAVTHLFPPAAAIAELDPEALPMPRSRGRTLVGIAAELAAGRLVLDDAVDRPRTVAALLALPGIGPWTAGYIAMRALGDPDAFTPGDAGLRHGLVHLGSDPSPRETERVSEPWRPYRAYAIQHLWALAA